MKHIKHMKGIGKVKGTLFIFIFILMLSVFPVLAQEEAGENEYTVKKGDTLWDITSKELKDPFLWPKVWKENPAIADPDRIYPGQTILIPLDEEQTVVGLPAAEAAKKEPTPQKIEPSQEPPLIDKNLIIGGGYITPSLHSVGKVVGAPTERNYFGTNDYVYIETISDEHDTFYIVNADHIVTHPHSGRKLGVLVQFLGIVKIVGNEAGYTKAHITHSYSEISREDILIPFYVIEPPEKTFNEKPFIDGTIVETKRITVLNGQFDIAYTDKGTSHGVMVGDIFTVYSYTDPKRPIGTMMVLSARSSTSVAYLTKSEREVLRGDNF